MDLKRIDLNLLVAFDVLMAERSVTRAAKRMAVGQSAMSATLARLRLLFDDPVLVREGRQLIATPVAEKLHAPIRQILNSVETTLAQRREFNPRTDRRTFSIVASDYVTLIFLQPLMRSLYQEAPNVKLLVRPTIDRFAEQLQYHGADILIVPREVFHSHADFPHEALFSDRYVCAFDADHPEIGNSISLKQFSRLPYLAASTNQQPSLGELQLDRLGITRNTEITTGLTLAYFLLRGTRLISLVHERLGRVFEKQLNLRLLSPPMKLDSFHEVMVWVPRNTDDPGHSWLRQRMRALASELFADAKAH